MTRCVRRAYLCGSDPLTGRSYEHRKQWVEERLSKLADIFAVDVYAYAVMGNHVHVVVYADPQAPDDWADELVVRRWRQLSRRSRRDATEAEEQIVQSLLGDTDRIEELRRRLGSLSWFMRYLNEFIARRANREDECSGRFWEGRFKSQAILDDRGLLACMVYVDLNPLRAGASSSAARAPYTSARKRSTRARRAGALSAVYGILDSRLAPISEAAYLELLAWTGSRIAPHSAGRGLERSPIATTIAAEVSRGDWNATVLGIEDEFSRAIGSAEAVARYARLLGLRWIKGVRFARRVCSAI